MPLATVKWFNRKKGFGFLLDGGGPDIFVHYKAIQTEGLRFLDAGEQVEYEAADGPRGRYAISVRPLTSRVKTTENLAQPTADGEGI